ncbi:stAR-related lipid transfer protein 9-like isoform X1 [Danio aesculapii]|uniref:stAR-related lipid transfer protein 9-like isoform X1 n=1 Tax=Danio aesculapii TaxID=1142201 RepID=UPI0024BFB7CA|nr:stAR-related lipid transfer protein 9-like isoform X1 [Danio aesculapii]
MANVKVAIRVRPLNTRESLDGGRLAVQVEDKVVRVRNVKLEGRLDGRSEGLADSREKLIEFGFDYCYWSVDPAASNYASQEEVFQDLGVCVLSGASEGYNVCLFAYGQTGSGKTYTMMGTPDSIGLTPRICQGLFRSGVESADGQSCRVEISFLEIYNERVRDLLRGVEQKKPAPLRVREHPEKGPYVQGLSQHVVTDYKQAVDLLEEGIANRITAATHVHDASSRSHAIFTIQYTQAILENNLPSEIVSKINLVDLAGSERADTQYCRDRITEGANINKSLVTLGIVISALAQNCQMSSSSQSINSMLSEGEGSTVGSQSSSLSGSGRRHCFIPYRDSVLTWLLKDSLGGNSKTIMIATVSPSSSSYNETLSTLRYAAHARNIVNKPRVNEDVNVRLIRELREEIDRLKSMLLTFEMQRNPSPSLSDERESSFSDIVLQNEMKVEQLTKDWSDSWHDKRALLERYSVDINQDRAGVLIHSLQPHLIALEPDVLSTGVTIYHLQEGVTRIGPQTENLEDPDIVLPDGSSCEIENKSGVVTLKPVSGHICMVSEREITEPCRLAQGAVITLGGLHKFRFNHPAEAAVLRERRRTSEGGLVFTSTELNQPISDLRDAGAGCDERGGGTAPRQRLEEQQWYIECLREEIQMEQKRAERDLEREQARLRQQHHEIQQWILQENQRLAAHREKTTLESGVQTDLALSLTSSSQKDGDAETVPPSISMGDRKRVVQEELLKHHALRRAENRVRRKRLHYQLEKIARKRHLLEAKRELQRLENMLLEGCNETSSLELGYSSKLRGRPRTLRRHSFSADLLSRLYPQHTPIFSQFLKRNRSSDFTYTKWESDEYLQDQKIRRRSNTMPSRYDQGSSNWASFSDNLKSPLKDSSSAKAKTASSRLLVKKSTSDQDEHCLDSNTKAVRKVLPIIKQKSSVKGTKSLSQNGNKSLETFRKVFSNSLGSGIRTALAKVFRKPPSGSRGHKGVKSMNKAIRKFNEKSVKNKTEKDLEKKHEQSHIKSAMSYESLGHDGALKYQQQRHWHSAEALTSTKQWVEVQNKSARGVEQGDVDDRSSDCDSIFSLDSLSSAYARTLAEQLQQEECDSSEAESEDNQMSQDSLVMENSQKQMTARPVLRFNKIPSHLTVSASCGSPSIRNKLDTKISKDVPAEVFWSLNGSQKLKIENGQGIARGASSISFLASESRPCSGASNRETENPLALTDAWSSTDAADSPRIIKASGHFKQDPPTLIESSSLDLIDNTNVSESQSSPRSDTSQDDNATLEPNDTSFENTLLLDNHESEPTFIPGIQDFTAKKDPCTVYTVCDSTDASLLGVACTSKPTAEPLKTNVTEALLIDYSSKDGDISTGSSISKSFLINSTREDSDIREDNPSLSHDYPTVCQVPPYNNTGNSEIQISETTKALNELHSIASNGQTNGQCDEEKDLSYTTQSPKMDCERYTKDYALTIKQSEKHDEKDSSFGRDVECFIVQPVNETCETKGFVGYLDAESSLLNSDQEQSACSSINSESVTNISLLENLLTKMQNSDQDKEMKSASSASDAYRALISKDHISIFRNDCTACDNGLTQRNCTSLKSFCSPEIKNFTENSKEHRKDAVQITDRKTLNNRYFQMSDTAINDKISEVVKEHFNLSLREDCGEDYKLDRKKKISSLTKLDESKMNHHEYDYRSMQDGHCESSCSQPLAISTDNTIVLNGNAESRNLLKDQAFLKSRGTEEPTVRKTEEKVERCGYINDDVESVLHCTIEAQGTFESMLPCVKETVIGLNTSKENIIVCTELRKDYTVAANPIEIECCTRTEVMENGSPTVLKPAVCKHAQATQTIQITNEMDKELKVNQYAQIKNETKLNQTWPTSIEMQNFYENPLMHGPSGLLNEIRCSASERFLMKISTPVESSKCDNLQASLPTKTTVKQTVSLVTDRVLVDTWQKSMKDSISTLLNLEVQNKKPSSHNSSTSSMEHWNSTEDDSHPVPEARPLSKLAFYEFGPRNHGKPCDEPCAEHSLKNDTNMTSSCGNKDKERAAEPIHMKKDAGNSDLGQASQKPQIHNELIGKTERGKTDKDLQSERQSIYTSNNLKTTMKSQCSDGHIKASQTCDNQQIKNQEPCLPKNYQSTSKSLTNTSSHVEVYHNAKHTPNSQNAKKCYDNQCQPTDTVRRDHCTVADATKHFVSNGNVDKNKGGKRRYRRAHFMAPPSSSTDSTSELSLDECTTTKSHASRKKSSSKVNLLPNSQNAYSRHKNPVLDEQSKSSPLPDFSRALDTQKRCTKKSNTGVSPSVAGAPINREAGIKTAACQQKNGSTVEIQPTRIYETKHNKNVTLGKNASSEDILVDCEGVHGHLVDAFSDRRDSAMHFASSDINPYIHTRTTISTNPAVHKKQAFGSVANISCHHSPPSSSNKSMTRCCSVDNGLNIQDCPFSSHLSTYVNNKGLSSTLSSNGYSRDQISSEPLLKATSLSSSGLNKQTPNDLKCDSCDGASEEFCNSSGQVDEIVLVYSSEYESQEQPNPSTCDQGTQTIEANKDLKIKSRHRRSSTQTPVSKPGNSAQTTWASLQNMSEHLSDLIHNTSDLLGNIQFMRTGEKPSKHDLPKPCFQVSTAHSGSNYKRDCCTQLHWTLVSRQRLLQLQRMLQLMK